MKTRIILSSLALIIAIALPASQADAQTIAGKWLALADTPNGPVNLVFEIRQDGSQLTGTALVFETTTPISSLRFEGGKFSGEIVVMGGTYKLAATLSEGKMAGTWEQVGGDYKGTWTAEREAAAPAAANISGSWDVVAATPEGDAQYLLELSQQGDALSGTIGSDMGSAPLTAASYKDGKLHFEVDGGGNVYVIDGAPDGENLKGTWAIAGGGPTGAWSAKRKGAAAPAGASAQPSVNGTWDGSADTEDGARTFQMQIQQDGGTLTGQIPTPGGAVPLQKMSFAGGKLSFELEYMGGTYRIEATVEGNALKGKWSAVDGSDSGAFTAQKKNP